ncbi:hypothetical protein HK405_012487, partial [Cladochytrium tenue]
ARGEQLAGRVSALEARSAELLAVLAAGRARADADVRDELGRLDRKNAELAARNAELAAAIADLEAAADRADAEVAGLEAERAELQSKWDSLRAAFKG